MNATGDEKSKFFYTWSFETEKDKEIKILYLISDKKNRAKPLECDRRRKFFDNIENTIKKQ
jgi:hypothetical protein